MAQKILVAMDESENARRAIDYIADNFSRDHDITLFSVILDTAAICNMSSPELVPYFQSQQAAFCSIEDKKKELVDEALEKAKKDLAKAGFDEGRITIKVGLKDRTVARDIIDEAHKGYDTVIIGRRGVSGLEEFFLGSVSHKVVNGVKDHTVILVK